MKMDTLKENWKEYKLIQTSGEVNLKDVFMLCYGYYKGGLLFDVGGEQGAPAYILKPDDRNNCYGFNSYSNEWVKVGKLKRIGNNKKE